MVLVFSRADLHYQDYLWRTSGDDSVVIKGFPDDVLLNRKEGYEMLYFINRFIEGQNSWRHLPADQKIEVGRKIERMIHDQLPPDVRSHANVHFWVVQNWTTFV